MREIGLQIRFRFRLEISLVTEPAVSQSSYGSLAFSLVGDPQCCFNKRNQALKLELLSTISTTRSTLKKLCTDLNNRTWGG